jgi:uncharacterized protein YgbK (DUF1537 family)
MLEWLVLADDRSGALEVAGEIAPWSGPVTVTVGSAPCDSGIAVVDIASRHCPPSAAVERALCAAIAPARRRMHKIDSTLRGNWADELVAVHRASGERVLVVPAFPRLGRTCRGGVVHVGDEPLRGGDARHVVGSPRVAAHLVRAGAAEVDELADADGVRSWLTGSGSFAVCDATSDDDLTAIGDAWRANDDVRFAGTAGSIAAAVSAVVARPPDRPPVTLDGDVLVVCGSLHPTARAQVAALDAATGVAVLTSPPPAHGTVTASEADRVAAELGAAARTLLARQDFGVLFVIGGDTAAAVLGDDPVVVGGTLAPGVPWSRRSNGSGPLLITKAGGFGDPSTLVELLANGPRSAAR